MKTKAIGVGTMDYSPSLMFLIGPPTVKIPSGTPFNIQLIQSIQDYTQPDVFLFVDGTFSEKQLERLHKDYTCRRGLQEARRNYVVDRKNGVRTDSPPEPFPRDGSYAWDTPGIRKSSKLRYIEGPKDKAWMQARDRNYVLRLKQEGSLDLHEPNLATEMPLLYQEVNAVAALEEKVAEPAPRERHRLFAPQAPVASRAQPESDAKETDKTLATENNVRNCCTIL